MKHTCEYLWPVLPSIVHSPQSRQNDFLITQIRLFKVLQCLPISPGIKLNLISWPVWSVPRTSFLHSSSLCQDVFWSGFKHIFPSASNVITLALHRVSFHLCEFCSIVFSPETLSNTVSLPYLPRHSLAPFWFCFLLEYMLIWNNIICFFFYFIIISKI